MEENINQVTKIEGNSASVSKKSLSSYLNFLNNEFLNHLKDDVEMENSGKTLKEIYTFISSILISLSIYFPFFIYNKYSKTEIYSNNIFLLFHSLSIIILIPIITYFYERKNIITEINYLQHKKWFFLRSNLNFIGMIFFLFSIKYFRCITIQILIISSISIIILTFGYYIGGNLTQNLIFGLFCFLAGNSLIIYNEIRYINNNRTYNNILGLIYIILSFSAFSSIKIINQKYINLDNHNLLKHMMLNNLIIFLYNIIFLPVSFFKGISLDLGFIILTLLSGIFFCFAIFFLVLVLEKENNKNYLIIPMLKLKLLFIYNLNIFYVFLLCLFLKEEKILFKDFIAEVIIFLFKIYNGNKELKDIPCFFN